MGPHSKSHQRAGLTLKKDLIKIVIFISLFVLKSDQFSMPAHSEVAQILVSYWKQEIWEQFKSQILHILKT